MSKNLVEDNLRQLNIDLIDLNQFDKLITLRNENGSHTYLIKNKETGLFYEATDSITSNYAFLKIMEFYSELKHPTIQKLIGYSIHNFDKKPDFTYITEHVKNMSLSRVIGDNRRGLLKDVWNDTTRLITIYGIASSMKYLHKNSIIHRDLEPQNVFIDEYLQPKIGGILHSIKLNPIDDQERKLIIGTAQFIAPEIWRKHEYSEKSDVYSFAIVAYEIFEETIPFDKFNREQIAYNVGYKSMKPKFSDKTPTVIKELIESCWKDNPNERPSFEDIVNNLESNKEFVTNKIDEKLYRSYIEIIHEAEEGNDITAKQNQIFPKFDSILKEEEEEEEESQENGDFLNVEIFQNLPKINLNKFEFINQIALGGSSNIFLIKHKETGKLYAAKQYKFHSEIDINSGFFLEAEFLSKLNYPTIVKILGYSLNDFDQNPAKIIIIEYIKNGNLAGILRREREGIKYNFLNNTMKQIIIYGIASSMKYLHSLDILHLDLKPQNILLDDFLQPKLCDFSISDYLKSIDYDDVKGTPTYIAPEVFSDKKYTKACDVYSFSMVLYEILTGEIPLKNLTYYQIYYFISIKKERPRLNDKVPKIYKKLIESCWNDDPTKRPSFEKIVNDLETNHEFILQDVDEKLFQSYIDILHESEQGIEITAKLNQTFPKYDVGEYDESFYKNLKEANSIEIKIQSLGIKEINIEEFEKVDGTGSGSYGTVYKIQHKETSQIYAAKKLKSEDNVKRNELDFFRELEILSKVNHPLILKLIGYSLIGFDQEPSMFIVTEFIINGDLEELLNNERSDNKLEQWNETMKLINIYGIASSMSYLHSLGIYHLDLKPLNILLNEFLFPIICDFGLSMKTEQNQQINGLDVRSICYCSPEIIENNSATSKSDVFSFGMLLYEMITNTFLYSNLEPISIIYQVTSKKRPILNKTVPNVYKNLIKECWDDDPNKRPSFDEIVRKLRKNVEFIELLKNQENKNQYKAFIEIIDEEMIGLDKSIKKKEYFKDYNLEELYEKKNAELYELSSCSECPSKEELESMNEVCHDDFSKTYSFTEKSSKNRCYATLSNFGFDFSTKEEFLNEVKALLSINHPSIQRFYGYNLLKIKRQIKPMIKTEYFEYLRLYDILEKVRKSENISNWNETKKLINIYGISSALLYLNSHNVQHPTLNPKNVLVDSNFQPKLSEIGFFTQPKNSQIASKMTSFKVDDSIFYLSPEKISNANSDQEKSDVYSLAIVSYEILTNEIPFDKSELKRVDFYSRIVKGDIRPSFNKQIPEVYQQLIEKCVSSNQNERPSLFEIVNQLKNDPNFITEGVDKEEYDNYKKIFHK